MSAPVQQAQTMLTPLGGHAVFLLLIQLAILLAIARLGAELSKRAGLPAVVGELAAGIVAGPTVFGHFFPVAFAAVFPHDAAQFHLLEVVGTLGMVLLLLLTGLETDLRLLRNLGRAALIASAMGMLLPFATGLGLGFVMPDEFINDPTRRVLFSFFLATAMSISAMPVIAKILMDLELTKRNIGLVILSAGVVDDTAGWLVLSVIAGVASHGEVRIGGTLNTIALMVGFLAAVTIVLYPLCRFGLGAVNRRFRTPDADMVFVLIVALICAATTEWIGIHAVFGAFICGTMFRQVPHLRPQTVHKLETFVFSVLGPVFFGIVGLKVDLWKLQGGGGWLGIVLLVACLGKLVGCTAGSLWGGLRFWEAFSIAVAMNARGAMELVVATIGLSLGILNQQMFSIIVMVAIVTSFLAPLGLRLTMRKVRLTEDESRRILAEESKGAFDPAMVRVLLPSAGGPNAATAAILADGIARRSAHPVEVLSIKAPTRLLERIRNIFFKPEYVTDDLREVERQVANVKRAVTDAGMDPNVRQVVHDSIGAAIVEEAGKDIDLLFIGASRRGNQLGGPILEEIIERAPCHVAIVKAGPKPEPFKSIFVPFDGGVFARLAVEFAVRYAETTGASVTIALLAERRPQAAAWLAVDEPQHEEEHATPEKELERVSRIFRASDLKPTILRLTYDPSASAVNDEASSGRYDLVVIGAENRAVRHRLFFGYNSERLLANDKLAVVIVVPSMARLSAN